MPCNKHVCKTESGRWVRGETPLDTCWHGLNVEHRHGCQECYETVDNEYCMTQSWPVLPGRIYDKALVWWRGGCQGNHRQSSGNSNKWTHGPCAYLCICVCVCVCFVSVPAATHRYHRRQERTLVAWFHLILFLRTLLPWQGHDCSRAAACSASATNTHTQTHRKHTYVTNSAL